MRPKHFLRAGIAFDLAHTFPRTIIAKTEGAPNGVRVRCVMSSHCFTVAEGSSASGAVDYRYEDERRVFNDERYGHSLRIFPLLQRALAGAATFNVFTTTDATGSSNYFVVDDLQAEIRYCIYFDVSRKRDEGGAHVLMQIRSAYLNRVVRLSSRDRTRLGTLIDRTLGLRPRARHRRRKK